MANSKNACMATHRHTDLKVFICYTALLERVILYYGFFRTEVSKLSPWELVSCRVQLQPLSNTPETANLSILETFRQVFWGKLELNSTGHQPSRTEFGHPALQQVTRSRMGTCWFFLTLILLVICNIFHWQPRMWSLHYNKNAENVKLPSTGIIAHHSPPVFLFCFLNLCRRYGAHWEYIWHTKEYQNK